MAVGRNVVFYVRKGAKPILAESLYSEKNSELAKLLAVFSFT